MPIQTTVNHPAASRHFFVSAQMRCQRRLNIDLKATRVHMQCIAQAPLGCEKPKIKRIGALPKVSRRDMSNEMMCIKEITSHLMTLCKSGLEPLLKDAFIVHRSNCKTELLEAANDHPTMLAQNPDRVMSFFQDRRVRCAAQDFNGPEQYVAD